MKDLIKSNKAGLVGIIFLTLFVLDMSNVRFMSQIEFYLDIVFLIVGFILVVGNIIMKTVEEKTWKQTVVIYIFGGFLILIFSKINDALTLYNDGSYFYETLRVIVVVSCILIIIHSSQLIEQFSKKV